MATTNLTLLSSTDVEEEEDYIDMELTSSSSSSPSLQQQQQQSRGEEFEFQMNTSPTYSTNKQQTADQLFYNGKLLPLMPPHFNIITCSTAPCTNTTNTPLDSTNISPSESCRVSCELNPDDYFFEWSTEFMNHHTHNHIHHSSRTKKHWSKKLKLIKDSIFTQKLKASRTYLKSLFSKPDIKTCGDVQTAYPTIASIIKNIESDDNLQRRSFSGAIKRHNPTKCLSSSSSGASSNSSFNSTSGIHHHHHQYHDQLKSLRRSSSATEVEGSIEAAIDHCKKSHKIFDTRDSEGGGICDRKKRSGLCSI